jgi:gliding motility-associated-like protein
VALWECDTIPPVADAGPDITICKGDSVLIGGHDYPDYYYSWWHDSICQVHGPTEIQRDEHKGKIWVKPEKDSRYYVQATDFKFDKTIDSVFVKVNQCTTTIKDTTICFGDGIELGNNSPFYNSWFWSPPEFIDDPYCSSPVAKPLHKTTFYCRSTDTNGRIRNDTVTIDVIICDLPPEIEIPNVITPNGDGINDVFRFRNEEFWHLHTQVFNRWGQLVFSGADPERWNGTVDGKNVSDGVYFYHISARADGFDKVLEYTGTVTVFNGK